MGNCLSPSTEQLAPISGEENVKVFTVAELKKATKDFGKEMVIGGSSGKVVKGYINPKTLSAAKEGVGLTVAVKKIHLTNDQAFQEWLVDLEFRRLNSHPSLVKLIGYGSDRGTLFIVSEYFPNGSLERHIYRETRSRPLPWETRLKISIGAAHCLAFLHSRKKAGLYQKYLTASNVLLDSEFNARISYFRLKSLPSHVEGTHVSSLSYSPPEYIFTGKSHMPGDVYSFGVILLDILTGYDGNQRFIVANDRKNIAEMIDPELANSYPLEQGMHMCEIIKQCLEEDPKKRPTMQQVHVGLSHLNSV